MRKVQTSAHMFALLLIVAVLPNSPVFGGDLCQLPDNGSGTVTLPPIGCQFTSPDEVFLIIDGLPPGTTIEMQGTLKDFICCGSGCPLCTLPLAPAECETVGGTLGGNGHCFEATLELIVTGTGDLAGYHRNLSVTVFGEVHTAPRNSGDPVQTFAQVIYQLDGQLYGDPDFCTFHLLAGTSNSLPNSGQCTLTDLGNGNFNVDSFFDITYQIQFEGCPGSPLDGFMGITTATIHLETGEEPPVCEPLPDGSGCVSTAGALWMSSAPYRTAARSRTTAQAPSPFRPLDAPTPAGKARNSKSSTACLPARNSGSTDS